MLYLILLFSFFSAKAPPILLQTQGQNNTNVTVEQFEEPVPQGKWLQQCNWRPWLIWGALSGLFCVAVAALICSTTDACGWQKKAAVAGMNATAANHTNAPINYMHDCAQNATEMAKRCIDLGDFMFTCVMDYLPGAVAVYNGLPHNVPCSTIDFNAVTQAEPDEKIISLLFLLNACAAGVYATQLTAALCCAMTFAVINTNITAAVLEIFAKVSNQCT